MATKISKVKPPLDTLEIHMNFEEKASWLALCAMDFKTAHMAFTEWFKDLGEEEKRRLKNAGKLVLINDATGDKHTIMSDYFKEVEEREVGRCDSIW